MKIRVSGEIIPNDYAWIYDFFEVDYFSPGKLADALKEADPADRELIVEINSPGGYVFSGFEIYSELRNLQALNLQQLRKRERRSRSRKSDRFWRKSVLRASEHR